MDKIELENRLIRFSVSIIKLCRKIPSTREGSYLAGQLIRSGCSPCIHYGEVQNASSKNDFNYKLTICQKELKESHINLKLIRDSETMDATDADLLFLIRESEELVKIFYKSIDTGKNKNRVVV